MRKPRVELSEAQRRALSVALSKIDEAMGEFESFARGKRVSGPMFNEVNEISSELSQEIQTGVTEIREMLQICRDEGGLLPAERDVLRYIWATLSILWEYTTTMASRYMKGYGEIPPETARWMDNRSAELESRVRKLLKLVSVSSNN